MPFKSNTMDTTLGEPLLNPKQHEPDRARELATLKAIAQTVSQSLDLEALLPATLDKMLELFEFESGAVYVKDLEGGEPVRVCDRGLTEGLRRSMLRGLVDATAADSRTVVLIEDLAKQPDVPRKVREEGYRSLMSVPLLSKEQVRGVLIAATRRLRRFHTSDAELLLAIGRQIGVALESVRLLELQRRQAEQFGLISEVGQHIISILDVDQLLGEIVSRVREVLGYYLVGIGLIEGDEVVVRRGVGPYWEIYGGQPLRLKVGQEGIVGWVAATGQPLLVADVSKEPRYYEVPQITETRSELAVPLSTKNQVIGVLDVQSRRLDAFDENDVLVLQSLANQAAMALENARLYETEQRRAEQFRVISEVGRSMTSILDVDELLERIVHLIRDTFGYDLVGIGLNEGEYMVTKTGAGPAWDEPQFQPPRLKVGEEGIMGWVAGAGEPILASDVGQEARYVFTPQTIGTRSEVCVPLKTKTATIGVLDVQSEELDAFDDSDLIVLQSLADQAAIAIENARLYEQAQQLAVLEERQRLGRELHDAVSQTLFSTSVIAEVLPRLWERDPDEGRRRLRELRQLTQGALAEMRTLLLELRPGALVEASLGDLLQQLAEAISSRARVPVAVTVEGEGSLPPDVKVSMYRIAQEGLNNVAKHAMASQAAVTLRYQVEQVELHVTDDGLSFDLDRVPPESLGLGIMRERAEAIGAALTIESEPRKGTQILAVWPDRQREEQR